jgi:hypothetical protein
MSTYLDPTALEAHFLAPSHLYMGSGFDDVLIVRTFKITLSFRTAIEQNRSTARNYDNNAWSIE